MRRLALILLLALPLLAQQNDPHAGQPDTCNNHFNTDPVHRCACEHTDCPAPDAPKDGDGSVHMTDKCKTYCKPEHCHCVGPCST